MERVIIFDFWGTLVENGVYSPLRQAKQILNLDSMAAAEFFERFERAMMKRHFAQLRDAFDSVCNEFGKKCDEAVMEKLIGIWNKNWLLAKPFADALPALGHLKENHRLVLISNTDNVSVQALLDKFELRQYFDLILLSCDCGHLKTEPEFYRAIFEQLDVTPDECLAVGDSIESDVVAAQNADVKVKLIDRRNRRDFHSKISSLDELWK